MSVYNPTARLLWSLTGSGLGNRLSGAATTNGPAINLSEVTDVWLGVYAAGTSTGTSPTLDVQLDVQDADGNWIAQAAKITQITSAPNYASVSAGLHVAGSGSLVLPAAGRVTWTLGGTTPVFPGVSISLYGR